MVHTLLYVHVPTYEKEVRAPRGENKQEEKSTDDRSNGLHRAMAQSSQSSFKAGISTPKTYRQSSGS